ncbi:MAG: ABC transporter permease [Thermoanaerobaculia bacterium]|nr:ABC transporter permease [Thermoanaerobaculia bacterium]
MTPPTEPRGGRREATAGAALLVGVLVAALVGAALWPHAPHRSLDPAVAALAPPGARFATVELADGRRLAATSIVAAEGGLRLLSPGGERFVPREAIAAGAGVGEARFWLGSDRHGRDVAARLLAGARLSLAVGGAAVALALLVGVPLGLAAGLARGGRAVAAVAVIETAQAFPRLFLVLALAAVARPGPWAIVLLLGLTGWMPVARLVRAEVRRVAAQEFVLAARAGGVGALRLASRHVLPNAMAPVVVEASLGLAGAVSAEAALAFLGLGAPPPAASWGNLIADGRDVLSIAPWISLAPGVALAVTLLACNLMAEGLRARSDPRAAARHSG